MKKFLMVVLCVLLAGLVSRGQVLQASSEPQHVRRDKGPVHVRLILDPAQEPVPALRHQLQVEVIDRITGNAALAYSMALIHLSAGEHSDADLSQVREWLDLPLSELPRAEVKAVTGRFALSLDTVVRATRYETCDWQLPIREDGFSLLLPHLTGIRDLARVLAVRARYHIAEGSYDLALADLRTGLTMARHVGGGATLIEGLVGIACAQMMLDRLEEWMGSPGSPSLYWALTELSASPLFSVHEAMRWERSILYVHVPALRDQEGPPITAEEYLQFIGEIGQLAGMAGDRGIWFLESENQRLAGTAFALMAYPRAREALLADGMTAEALDAMPVSHLISRYLASRYERHRDDIFKWTSVSSREAGGNMRAASARLTQAMKDDPLGSFLPGVLLPAVLHAQLNFEHLDRRIAALRCVAGLRLALADAGKRFPASLDEIDRVPIPEDPMTGEPFMYITTGEGARLELPVLPRQPPRHGRVFELTVSQ